MCRPAAFSETKFANSASLVYSMFRVVYPALLITLSKVKEDLYNGKSSERDKAQKADEVQGAIHNWLFALSLSVCVDIYSVYGAISKILQIVSILPHVRLDKTCSTSRL